MRGQKRVEDARKRAYHSRIHRKKRFIQGRWITGSSPAMAANAGAVMGARTIGLASGIGAKALLSGLIPEWLILVTGSVLVLFSAFCFGAAVWRHLEPGVPPPRIDVSRIPPWVLVAVNGFLALVALAALVGIWFGRPPGVSS